MADLAHLVSNLQATVTFSPVIHAVLTGASQD